MEKKSNKIIHYIWFGGNPLSDLTKKCIQTWKKYLPDFEIMEWNENTFDVNQCPFVKEAYEQKKWAFVADYTRFKVLEEYGGIYLDTDMEITGDISKFLEKDLFFGVEDSKMINAAVVWAKEAHNPYIKDIVNIYENKKKFNETGDLYAESVPRVLTKYFEEYGFDRELDKVQELDDGKIHIYPMEYFYPLSYDYQHNNFTDNTVMIHHFDATWISPMEKFKTKMKRKNMIWVVYVIDFFINLKNKVKFFLNNRDIVTFFTMFLIIMSALLALTPLDFTSLPIGNLKSDFSVSFWQVLIISLLWTFFTAKTRNIHLNFYTDKLLGRKQEDIDNGDIDNKPLDLTQTLKLQKREKILFTIQYIITIVVSLFPVMQIANIVPNGVIFYTAVFLINLYMIWIGINKNFRFRILELIPFGIILGLLIVSNFSSGLLISISTFIFVLINIIKNEPKKKRLYTFVASFSICFIIALGICLFTNSMISNISLSCDLFSDSVIEQMGDYTIKSDIITEFNYLKDYFSNGIETISSSSLLISAKLYFVLSIIMTLILSLVNKNKNYLFIIVLIVLNSIQLLSIGINLGFINVIVFSLLLLLVVQKTILNILDKN